MYSFYYLCYYFKGGGIYVIKDDVVEIDLKLKISACSKSGGSTSAPTSAPGGSHTTSAPGGASSSTTSAPEGGSATTVAPGSSNGKMI